MSYLSTKSYNIEVYQILFQSDKKKFDQIPYIKLRWSLTEFHEISPKKKKL